MRFDRGFVMQVDPVEWSGQIMIETGDWEPDVSNTILKRLKDGAVFVDVGAHIGFYTLYASKLVVLWESLSLLNRIRLSLRNYVTISGPTS